MTTRTKPARKFVERELVINRTFNAPRERVFNAWIDQKLMAQWWGPQGFTNPVCELDARPGGAIRIDMRGPDGALYPMKGVFHEIVPPQRLVFTSCAFEDEKGDPQLVNINTVVFIGMVNTTQIMLQADVVKTTPAVQEALEGMSEGWNQSLDRLEELLAKT